MQEVNAASRRIEAETLRVYGVGAVWSNLAGGDGILYTCILLIYIYGDTNIDSGLLNRALLSLVVPFGNTRICIIELNLQGAL